LRVFKINQNELFSAYLAFHQNMHSKRKHLKTKVIIAGNFILRKIEQ